VNANVPSASDQCSPHIDRRTGCAECQWVRDVVALNAEQELVVAGSSSREAPAPASRKLGVLIYRQSLTRATHASIEADRRLYCANIFPIPAVIVLTDRPIHPCNGARSRGLSEGCVAMGAAFNRWLAKPTTLHPLRHLQRLTRVCTRVPQITGSRWVSRQPRLRDARATVTPAPPGVKDGYDVPPQQFGPVSGQSTLEDGLRMSMSSGVALLGEETGDRGYQSLQIQADVDSVKHLGRLLVDQPEYRTNMQLWIELLQYRHRIDGAGGVYAIWRGIRRRHIDLPTEGEEADVLWSTLANACISDHNGTHASFLNDLLRHAEDLYTRTGARYSKLYATVMSRVLRFDWGTSRARHDRLRDAGLLPSDGIKQLIVDVVGKLQRREARQACRHLYTVGTERDLYDVCIAKLLAMGDEASALTWHRFLLRFGDGPSREMFARRAVQRLFDRDRSKSLPMMHNSRVYTVPAVKQQAKDFDFPALTRSSMSSLIGDVHGIKPKEVSDSFVAKMFATRAFSLDLVLHGLSFFGVDQLGPLAAREMALRTGSLDVYRSKLDDLRTLNITFSDALYCRLINVLVHESYADLFREVLESDQHPDVYADLSTQEALLVSYLDRSQWNNAHISLLCLSLGGAHLQGRAWNRLLQHYLQNRQWRPAAGVMQTLQSQRVPLTRSTISLLHSLMLPERRPARRPIVIQRPDKPDFDALRFVTGAYMYNEELSGNVYFKTWIELLKRYGMCFQWEGLEKLVLWLATNYSNKGSPESQDPNDARTQRKLRQRSSSLRSIFDPIMQQAIVHWGFKSAAVRNQLHPESAKLDFTSKDQLNSSGNAERDTPKHERWAQGIALLRRLRLEFGMNIHTGEVRRAFYQRMLSLFGPGHSQLKLNERMRESNGLTLTHYIRHANEVWDGIGVEILVDLDDTVLDLDAENDPKARETLLLAFFGPYRRSKYFKPEWVDVTAWSRSQHIGARRPTELYRGRKMGQRMFIWQRSPFRVDRSTLPLGAVKSKLPLRTVKSKLPLRVVRPKQPFRFVRNRRSQEQHNMQQGPVA